MGTPARTADNRTPADALSTVLENTADLKRAIKRGVGGWALDQHLKCVELSAAHARKVIAAAAEDAYEARNRALPPSEQRD